jgi:histidinol-phosphate aminotransferase
MIFRASRLVPSSAVEHGGPDGGPSIHHDFSTNANPLPAPERVLQALARADRSRYPDPHYTSLREQLADFYRVERRRVLVSAGTSEAIRRLTLAAAQRGRRQVWVPEPGYGDYRATAWSLGLPVRTYADGQDLLQGLQDDGAAALVWLNEPHSPTGQSLAPECWSQLAALARAQGAWLALDRAYEPLRLVGADPVPDAVAQQCWQCWSPNKSLGLTGVRAGCILAPEDAGTPLLAMLQQLAPSWVLSAEGVGLLQAMTDPLTQAWLAGSREQLRAWQARQRQALHALGWAQRDSVTPFWLARPPVPAADLARRLLLLRDQGIKLRNAQSFGLPGWVRLSTQAPAAQLALGKAWASISPRPAGIVGSTLPPATGHQI